MLSKEMRNIIAPALALVAVLSVGGYAIYSNAVDIDNEAALQSAQSAAALEGGRQAQSADNDGVEVVDKLSEVSTKDVLQAGVEPDTNAGGVPGFDNDGNPVDMVAGDEFYQRFLEVIRSEWADGSNPQLTTNTSMRSFIHSVQRSSKPLPNLNKLAAKILTKSMTPGDGYAFYDKDGKHVVSLVFDSTRVNPGDPDALKVAYIQYPKGTEIASSQSPLTDYQAKELRDLTNMICTNTYLDNGMADNARAEVLQGYFNKPVEMPQVKRVEFYQPKFLYIDYNADVDGISVVCSPMNTDSAIRVNYAATGNNSYVGESLIVEQGR